jgi:hypothetical protein
MIKKICDSCKKQLGEHLSVFQKVTFSIQKNFVQNVKSWHRIT